MFRNYLKVAFRSILKNKVYSSINILGLTVGMTCAILIFLYVQSELGYELHHKKANNIQRLVVEYFLPDNNGSEKWATMGAPVGEVIAKDYAEIVQSVRIRLFSNQVIKLQDQGERFCQTIAFADSNIFKVFTLPLISGNPETALKNPFSAVISENVAIKYFGKIDVLGEILELPDRSSILKITGVMKNIHPNTHLNFDFLVSFSTQVSLNFSFHWWNFSYYTYLELVPETDIGALELKIKRISANYILDQEESSGYRQEYSLQNFRDIHLTSNLRGEMEPNSKKSYVYIFSVIGVFILVIACINFMNLATARSVVRAKEVGLRKVAGAYRSQLVGQFLGESIIMALLSLLLSIGLALLLLPHVNQFTNKELSLNILNNSGVFLALISITFFTGIFSGSYPAIFLSSFNPAETLKGDYKTNNKGIGLRKFLVVFQFAISIALIAGTLVVFNQLQFLKTRNLGFNKEQVIFIPTRHAANASQNFKLLKEELIKRADIVAVSMSSAVPGKGMGNNVVRLGWDDDAIWSDMRFLAVDYDFLTLFDIKMKEGRYFDERNVTDEQEAFIINESGRRRLGFESAELAIGKPLKWQNRKGRVIGVINDFHFMSPNKNIEPFIMVMNGERTPGYLSLKISSKENSNIISEIESAYKKLMPEGIFEYSFLNEDYSLQFKADERFYSLFSMFSLIAISIACLGLYGLSAFTAELRFKEIGIRKVLGANVFRIILLLSKDYSRLVILAFIPAIPISYFAMSNWLQDFPYKAEINPVLFIFAGLISLVVALITTSFHAVRAALINPVDSIKYE